MGRRIAASLAAFLALAAAACGSTAVGGSSAPAGFAGYKWSVVAIGHAGKETAIPAHYGVDLQFAPNGAYLANDPVNTHFGTYRRTADGFTTSEVGQTTVGYIALDPVIPLAVGAITALDNVGDASVKVTGNQLDVSAAGYTLTCERAGVQANFPAPAHT